MWRCIAYWRTLVALAASDKESLARQKQLLNKRLGLDVAGGLGLTGDAELFAEEDFIVKPTNGDASAEVSAQYM